MEGKEKEEKKEEKKMRGKKRTGYLSFIIFFLFYVEVRGVYKILVFAWSSGGAEEPVCRNVVYTRARAGRSKTVDRREGGGDREGREWEDDRCRPLYQELTIKIVR